MKTTKEYLNDVLTRHRLTSFQELADLIGISRQGVHDRIEHGGLSPIVAVRVAQALDLPPLLVIAATQAEKAKTDEEKALWAKIYAEELAASRQQRP